MRRPRFLPAVVATLALLVLGRGPVVWAQATAVVGQVQTVRGTVSLIRGTTTTALTRGGVSLRIGDTVRTGSNGRARIVTRDGKRATLGPNSSVRLGRPGKASAWQVQAGRVAIWVTGRGRTEVSTPGAVAASEGTGFEILVAEDGETTLTVAEGTVLFYNDQGRVTVGENQQSVARPGEAPSRPIAVDASGILIFEGTVENLPLPLEPPRFFKPDPGREQQFGVVLAGLEQRRPDLVGAAVMTLGTTSPNTAEAELASGLFLLAQGKAVDATPPLTRVGQLAATSPVGPTYLGLALFRQGKLQEAEDTLREAIRREPNAYAAHAYLANVLLARGGTAEAETSARRAVELADDSSLAHEALGTALLFGGKPLEAAADLNRALELNPLSPSGHLQLAKALAAADQLEEALAEGSQAVALDPDSGPARVTLGVLFMANKDARRAEREFRYAIKLAPDMAAARSGLGAVAAQQGRFARALREQKAALELDEGSAQIRNNLGVALTARGSLRAALVELKAAVKLQPQYAVAHANLAIAYLELNQFAKAVRSAERAVKLGDRSAFVHTTLARIYMRQRRFDRALASLRRSMSVDPEYPLQHFYLAQIYLQQGRNHDSQRALFRGITLDPAAMVEQRQFARTEFSFAGGENGALLATVRTDGRAANGKISYFGSYARLQSDGPRRNDDMKLDFSQTIFGYQPNPDHNIVVFGSLIDERAGRLGRVFPGGVQSPLFRSDLNGTDVQVMSRSRLNRDTSLTLKSGYRRLSSLGMDPLDTFIFRRFRAREDNIFAEAQLEHQLDERNALVTGLSFVRNARQFDGRLPLIPGPGLVRVGSDNTPGMLTAYFEWHHEVDKNTNIILGPYVGAQTNAADVWLPKFVGRRELGDGNTVVLLVYPTFLERFSGLRPVETWAQPHDLGILGQNDGGYILNYEGVWQRSWNSASILTATGFYRDISRLLVPIVDPERSGVPIRAAFTDAHVVGGEVAYEQWLTARVSARAFGRYQHSRVARGRGSQEIPYLPKWVTGFRVDYVDTNGIRGFVRVNQIGSRRHIGFVGSPGRTLGSYTTVDVRLDWQMDIKRNFFIEVRDLFDGGPSYFGGFPGNGRTIIGGIDVRL